MEGDVLVYRSTVDHIPSLTRFFSELGVLHFNLWLLSAAGSGDENVVAEVPVLSEVVRAMGEALDLGGVTITSLHTPPCVVPAKHHACLFDAKGLDMVVMNPGGHSFKLETSPIEGGTFLERCAECSARGRCNGLRADYLSRYGDAEFRPLRG
jgi:MoaA/NifB/PqqE/SkfB family radical SAM enzyme